MRFETITQTEKFFRLFYQLITISEKSAKAGLYEFSLLEFPIVSVSSAVKIHLEENFQFN